MKMKALVLTALFLIQPAFAHSPNPTELGKYNIGYTKEVIINSNVALPYEPGNPRPMQIEYWYPTKAKHGSPVIYSLLGFNRTLPSERRAISDPSVASGKFPLIILSPGSPGTSLHYTDLAEIMASHGYIVVGINHTGNTEMDSGARQSRLGGHTSVLCPLAAYGQNGGADGNRCSHLTANRCQERPVDVRFMIDTMLDRNNNKSNRFYKSINKDLIGLIGSSFGGNTALTMVGGNSALAIQPDPRIKAIAMMEPNVAGCSLPASDSSNARIPVLTVAGSSEVGVGVASSTDLFMNQLVNAAPNYFVTVRRVVGNPDPANPNDLPVGEPVDKWTSHGGVVGNLCKHEVAMAKAAAITLNVPAQDVFLGPITTPSPEGNILAAFYPTFIDEAGDGDVLGDSRICPEYNQFGPLYIATEPSPFLNPYQVGVQLTNAEAQKVVNHYVVSFFETQFMQDGGYKKLLSPSYAKKKNLDAIVQCKDLGGKSFSASCAK